MKPVPAVLALVARGLFYLVVIPDAIRFRDVVRFPDDAAFRARAGIERGFILAESPWLRMLALRACEMNKRLRTLHPIGVQLIAFLAGGADGDFERMDFRARAFSQDGADITNTVGSFTFQQV